MFLSHRCAPRIYADGDISLLCSHKDCPDRLCLYWARIEFRSIGRKFLYLLTSKQSPSEESRTGDAACKTFRSALQPHPTLPQADIHQTPGLNRTIHQHYKTPERKLEYRGSYQGDIHRYDKEYMDNRFSVCGPSECKYSIDRFTSNH